MKDLLFKIEVNDGSYLKKIFIQALSELVENMVLFISHEGIEISQLDTAGVCVTSLKIIVCDFMKITSPNAHKIKMDTKLFIKIISGMSGETIFSQKKKENKLGISCNKMKATIILLDCVDETKSDTTEVFDSGFVILSRDIDIIKPSLKDYVNISTIIGPKLKIMMDTDKNESSVIKFTMDTSFFSEIDGVFYKTDKFKNSTDNLSFSVGEEGNLKNKVIEKKTLKYSCKYFTTFLKFSGLSQFLFISFSSGGLIKIRIPLKYENDEIG